MAKESPLRNFLDTLANNLTNPKLYEKPISRRGLALKTMQIATLYSTANFLTDLTFPYYELLLGNPEFDHPAIHTQTFYTTESFKKSHCIVLGDSIAKGVVERSSDFPATKFVKDLVEQIGAEWTYDNIAVKGASTQKIKEQIPQLSQLLNTIPQGENIDIVISAGGNDLGRAVGYEFKREDLKTLLQNKDYWKVFPFGNFLLHEIDDYTKNMTTLLHTIANLKENGHNIQRIFVEGLPDMGITDKLGELDDKGNPLFSIDLSSNENLQKLARNASVLMNRAMGKAIDNTAHVPIEFVLIDNFHHIRRNQMKGLHPTVEGYINMATQHLARSHTQFADGEHSFNQELRRKNIAI